MTRVALQGVSKRFSGDVVAVDAFDLEVADGELVVLFGPSGSGKTTLLRLVAGLERPTSGEIQMGGRGVTSVPPHRRDVAYVPQSCPLFPHLKVFDNLAFGGRLRNGSFVTRWWHRHASPAPRRFESGAEFSARIRRVAAGLGIGHLLERWPRQLSGGERQRVALGRALVREPAVFLFDEPLASLDATLRSELRTEIKTIQKRAGRPMMYVTHDPHEALALADRVVVLANGALQQCDTPAAVYDRPANRLVGQWIGAPPMNFLGGRLDGHEQRDGKKQWLFNLGDGWQLPLPPTAVAALQRVGGEAELGLRPEAIELCPIDAREGTCVARVQESTRIGGLQEIVLGPAHARAPGRLVAQGTVGGGVQAGELIGWRPRWEQAHWFDRRTGQRIEVGCD
jgi:ABC-type sugar transport system ATPase subunit